MPVLYSAFVVLGCLCSLSKCDHACFNVCECLLNLISENFLLLVLALLDFFCEELSAFC